MLMGTFNHSLDAKGRLIIPARLREDLGENFIITKSPDRCLSVYPEEDWKRFIEKLDTLPKISSEPARKLRRFYFANSSVLEVDKQGRILIPNNLREYASLSKDVTFIGVDDHVEIWDTAFWEQYNEDMDAGDIMYELNGIDL